MMHELCSTVKHSSIYAATVARVKPTKRDTVRGLSSTKDTCFLNVELPAIAAFGSLGDLETTILDLWRSK
jgi:hypothetical protein